MGKVILDLSISLDGFIAKPDNYRLHEWYFSSKDSQNATVMQELLATTGALIMGRRTYDLGERHDGFVDNPYQVPHFVVTHTAPKKVAKGNTTFVFVTKGIENAVNQAKAAAGNKNVIVGGGGNISQQLLNAGLIDELYLHFVPVIFGNGLRLFDDTLPANLEQISVVAAAGVTHLKYRI